MKNIQRFVSIVGMLAALAAPGGAAGLPRAQPKAVGMSAEKLDKIDAAVQEMLDRKQTAGAVVLVARKGKVVALKAFGKMDIAAGKDMRPDAIFRIASMTKPVTSVAALLLLEDGRLGLDDPVSKYIPALKGLRVQAEKDGASAEPRREVTVRDLMRHTSGLDYPEYDTGTGSLADWAGKLAGRPLRHQPGTRFNYSWDNDLLARVVEVVSGEPLDKFFRDRIFRPLDMKDTGFFVPKGKAGRFALTYTPGPDGELMPEPSREKFLKGTPKYLSGSGGLVSTASDYFRFCQMLLNGGELRGKRLLRADTVRQMTVNQLPDEALPMNIGGFSLPWGYGLGVGVRTSTAPAADPMDGELNWTGAASTFFWAAPKPQLVVIVMQQVVPINIGLMKVHPLAVAAMED